MTYDPDRDWTVLFGGRLSTADPSGDMWTWNGSNWRQLNPPAGPGPRFGHAAAFDRARRRLVVFGGNTVGGGSLELANDTWILERPRQPNIQLSATLPADLSLNQLRDVRIRARCGGTFRSDGRGAQILAWESSGPGRPMGAWRQLRSNVEGLPLSPTASFMDYQPSASEGAEEARSLVTDGQVHVQCRPNGGSIEGQLAEVGLDYAEVRIGYVAQ